MNDNIRHEVTADAHWVEIPVVWRTRRKYECSNCGSYVVGRFTSTPVKDIHRFCHACGVEIIGATEELVRDECGFPVQNT